MGTVGWHGILRGVPIEEDGSREAAVVGRHRHLPDGHGVGLVDQPGKGELGGSVDGHEEMELPLLGPDLGVIGVEEADGCALNFFLVCSSLSICGNRLMPWRW
jgi:hypothetical protein